MLLQKTFIALACCALVANASFWGHSHSKRRGTGGPRMQVQDRLPQFVTLPVSQLYYTHGDTDCISFTFKKEQDQKPHTVYSSTKYLITEITKILQDNGFNTRTKTGEAVSQALRQVQANLGEKLVPHVVQVQNGRWYSNNNRTLFCLQTVEKFFGKRLTTLCQRIDNNLISKVHRFSRLNDCCDIGFGFGGNLTPGQRKTMDKFWPGNQSTDARNPNASRTLNLKALRDHFDGANGLEKYYLYAPMHKSFGAFGNHGNGRGGWEAADKPKRRKTSPSKKKRDRSAWRRRLLLTTVAC